MPELEYEKGFEFEAHVKFKIERYDEDDDTYLIKSECGALADWVDAGELENLISSSPPDVKKKLKTEQRNKLLEQIEQLNKEIEEIN